MVNAQDNPDNPKKRYGIVKPSAEFVSPLSEMMMIAAMQVGGIKYGPFNWREKPVEAGTYYSAARRHWMLWMSGEDFDPETGIHHLGFAMACCNIVIDAQLTGNLIDNRPKDNGATAQWMAVMTENLMRFQAGYTKPDDAVDVGDKAEAELVSAKNRRTPQTMDGTIADQMEDDIRRMAGKLAPAPTDRPTVADLPQN